MAEYGKILPPLDPEHMFKKGQWKIILRIYIPLILLKLIIVIIVGDTYWERFFALIIALTGWRTVIDAIREDGKIRIHPKNKALTIVYRDKQPNYYWFCIALNCLGLAIMIGIFLATP